MSTQHELHFTAPSRALNLPPSLSLPELAEEWRRLLHTGPLPPQSLCQIAPAATTGVQSSSPTHQNGQGMVRPSGHWVEAEQHCRTTRRYTDTRIPRQHGNTNVWNMRNTPESQPSAFEITNHVVKPISVSAPAPFYFQLPSPQPTEQTSQHKTSPPQTPLPTATLSATPNGPRRSTTVDTVATKSSQQQLGTENPGPQKRLYVEINADGDAMNDGKAAKRPRLRAVHSSTPTGRTAHLLDKRRPERRSPLPADEPGNMTPAKPLHQPQDSTPRGDNRKVHDNGQLQGPQARPARPAKPIEETSREIPTDDCRACGFRTEHLFQLTEIAWR